MTQTTARDFFWADEREPHYQRRQEILKKHPEVRTLFGVDPKLKFITIALVVTQLAIGLLVGQLDVLAFVLVTYFIGATIAQALFLAIHEITHDLSSKSKTFNNWLALVANLPIVFPFAMSFKTYHHKHHWDQGKETVDTDIPTRLEAQIFRGFIGKLIWFVNQILFYAFRPLLTYPIKLEKWHYINIVFQLGVMTVYLPLAGWSGLAYLLLSIFLAGSLHPTAGHFISEHYVFKEGQETYSYYGPLNKLSFNVGYHNEHHDFHNIPGSRLPKLKQMAPEFYDHLHAYHSWTAVIFKFLSNKDISLYSRTKRK